MGVACKLFVHALRLGAGLNTRQHCSGRVLQMFEWWERRSVWCSSAGRSCSNDSKTRWTLEEKSNRRCVKWIWRLEGRKKDRKKVKNVLELTRSTIHTQHEACLSIWTVLKRRSSSLVYSELLFFFLSEKHLQETSIFTWEDFFLFYPGLVYLELDHDGDAHGCFTGHCKCRLVIWQCKYARISADVLLHGC